jgi:hypothetical protein
MSDDDNLDRTSVGRKPKRPRAESTVKKDEDVEETSFPDVPGKRKRDASESATDETASQGSFRVHDEEDVDDDANDDDDDQPDDPIQRRNESIKSITRRRSMPSAKHKRKGKKHDKHARDDFNVHRSSAPPSDESIPKTPMKHNVPSIVWNPNESERIQVTSLTLPDEITVWPSTIDQLPSDIRYPHSVLLSDMRWNSIDSSLEEMIELRWSPKIKNIIDLNEYYSESSLALEEVHRRRVDVAQKMVSLKEIEKRQRDEALTRHGLEKFLEHHGTMFKGNLEKGQKEYNETVTQDVEQLGIFMMNGLEKLRLSEQIVNSDWKTVAPIDMPVGDNIKRFIERIYFDSMEHIKTSTLDRQLNQYPNGERTEAISDAFRKSLKSGQIRDIEFKVVDARGPNDSPGIYHRNTIRSYLKKCKNVMKTFEINNTTTSLEGPGNPYLSDWWNPLKNRYDTAYSETILSIDRAHQYTHTEGISDDDFLELKRVIGKIVDDLRTIFVLFKCLHIGLSVLGKVTNFVEKVRAFIGAMRIKQLDLTDHSTRTLNNAKKHVAGIIAEVRDTWLGYLDLMKSIDRRYINEVITSQEGLHLLKQKRGLNESERLKQPLAWEDKWKKYNHELKIAKEGFEKMVARHIREYEQSQQPQLPPVQPPPPQQPQPAPPTNPTQPPPQVAPTEPMDIPETDIEKEKREQREKDDRQTDKDEQRRRQPKETEENSQKKKAEEMRKRIVVPNTAAADLEKQKQEDLEKENQRKQQEERDKKKKETEAAEDVAKVARAIEEDKVKKQKEIEASEAERKRKEEAAEAKKLQDDDKWYEDNYNPRIKPIPTPGPTPPKQDALKDKGKGKAPDKKNNVPNAPNVQPQQPDSVEPIVVDISPASVEENESDDDEGMDVDNEHRTENENDEHDDQDDEDDDHDDAMDDDGSHQQQQDDDFDDDGDDEDDSGDANLEGLDPQLPNATRLRRIIRATNNEMKKARNAVDEIKKKQKAAIVKALEDHQAKSKDEEDRLVEDMKRMNKEQEEEFTKAFEAHQEKFKTQETRLIDEVKHIDVQRKEAEKLAKAAESARLKVQQQADKAAADRAIQHSKDQAALDEAKRKLDEYKKGEGHHKRLRGAGDARNASSIPIHAPPGMEFRKRADLVKPDRSRPW